MLIVQIYFIQPSKVKLRNYCYRIKTLGFSFIILPPIKRPVDKIAPVVHWRDAKFLPFRDFPFK